MADQTHYAGETIRLTVEYRDTDTKAPTDPSTVTLTALTQGNAAAIVTLPTVVAFTEIQLGTWRLSVDTTGFSPDIYNWTVQATTAAGEIVLIKDYFVLTSG